jgi:hypothetical protein
LLLHAGTAACWISIAREDLAEAIDGFAHQSFLDARYGGQVALV